MSAKFIPLDRDTPYMLPPSIQDYLPEDHLARFVVEIVEQLDLGPMVRRYEGRGKTAYHPALLVALLLYGYSTGTFSSRKLEKATYESIAYRFICANRHPDHDTINSFRQGFRDELEGLFHQVLLIAQRMGLVKLGTVSLDGTKIKANASQHKALSWDYANRLEAQLKAEVEELLRLADAADKAPLPEAMDVPEELQRRRDRLARIEQAKAEIEARARERHAREQAAYEEKIARRKAQAAHTGKKPRGKEPTPPVAGPQGKDQVNLTDPESRIMPGHGGFQQAYNAQAAVDAETHLVVEQHLSQQPNDKREIEACLQGLKALPDALGRVTELLADTGYYSETNVGRCHDAAITPYIASRREAHHLPLQERFAEDPPEPGEPSPLEAMRHRLSTREGRRIYGRRKSTIETVFGIIKQVLGFRQFLTRGKRSVETEWSLVCTGWNLKRLHALAG
jgi:transposase